MGTLVVRGFEPDCCHPAFKVATELIAAMHASNLNVIGILMKVGYGNRPQETIGSFTGYPP